MELVVLELEVEGSVDEPEAVDLLVDDLLVDGLVVVALVGAGDVAAVLVLTDAALADDVTVSGASLVDTVVVTLGETVLGLLDVVPAGVV